MRKRNNLRLLTACLASILLFCSQWTSGQNISRHFPGESLVERLGTLHSAYGCKITYDSKQLNGIRVPAFNANNNSVEEVLEKTLEGTHFSYRKMGNNLFTIKEKKEERKPITSPRRSKTIHGIVKDENGEAIPGANITVRGGNAGVITDVDGKYSMDVPENAVLHISFVGYDPIDLKVENRPEVNVVLKGNTNVLNEVVLVGYGTQKKANLTGAIDQIGSEVFENRSVSNVTQALLGAVPNLNISLTDGKPTRSADFNIRGTTSIGEGGSALVLIDGVEGDPAMLNPNDIESVSVLKDASSAAIYGARGAYGVVLITTRNASKNKISINYSVNSTYITPVDVPNIVDDGYTYASMFYEAYYNARNATPAALNKTQVFSTSWLSDFKDRKEAGNTQNYEVVNSKYVYYGNENYYKALYKKSTFSQDQNISVSGNSGKINFYLSGRYYDYDGLFKYNTDNYTTYNIRAKESIQATDWLKITNNLDYSKLLYHNPINVGESGSIWRNIADEGHPSSPIFNPDGTLSYSAAYTVGDFIYGKNGLDTDKRIFKNTTSAVASFLDDKLHVNADFTYRSTDNNSQQIRVPVPYSTGPDITAYVGSSYNDITNDSKQYEYLASNIYSDYAGKIGKDHSYKLMMGYNYEQQKYNDVSVQRNGLLTEDVTNINLALGSTTTTSGEYSKWRTVGFFGRLNYSFADRYLFEFDGRYDGSSKFPTNQQWGFFPSASVGWRISEEPFWHVDKKLFSDLKIRASYGSLGNGNVDPYAFEELFTISNSGRLLNGSNNKVTSAPSVVPDGLTWETATTSDLGLDFGMLNGRLRFTGDAYIRKTKNMYTTGPTLPDVFGADSPNGNYADLTTRGWEISISYRDQFNLKGKPFHYHVKGTLADYTATIDKYNNSTGSLSDYYAGEKMGEIWGFHIEGLFKNQTEIDDHATQNIIYASSNGVTYPGDMKFADLDNSGAIDYGSKTLTSHGDMKVIGNTTPRYTYSFNLSGDWNNFFMSAFFQGVGHQDWYPSSECIFWGQYNRPYNNLPKWQLGKIWSEDNLNAYLPRYSGYNTPLRSYSNDRYLQNVAYLRLKNLQLGYNIPKELVSKIKMENLRIYVSGENLFCWSPLYKWTRDIDVANINGSDRDLTSGTSGDGQNYPIMKSMSLGVSFTF